MRRWPSFLEKSLEAEGLRNKRRCVHPAGQERARRFLIKRARWSRRNKFPSNRLRTPRAALLRNNEEVALRARSLARLLFRPCHTGADYLSTFSLPLLAPAARESRELVGEARPRPAAVESCAPDRSRGGIECTTPNVAPLWPAKRLGETINRRRAAVAEPNGACGSRRLQRPGGQTDGQTRPANQFSLLQRRRRLFELPPMPE